MLLADLAYAYAVPGLARTFAVTFPRTLNGQPGRPATFPARTFRRMGLPEGCDRNGEGRDGCGRPTCEQCYPRQLDRGGRAGELGTVPVVGISPVKAEALHLLNTLVMGGLALSRIEVLFRGADDDRIRWLLRSASVARQEIDQAAHMLLARLLTS